MSISTYQKLLNEIAAPNERTQIVKALGAVAQPSSTWTVSLALGGAAPTTAAVPTNATTGSAGQQNGGAAALRMVGGDFFDSAGQLWICDRLSHQGGLDATVTTAQTTNLPTAALTRYTTGAGVMAALEIYTQIGASGTTAACSYTNQAGTAGRTSPLIPNFGNTNFREINHFFVLPFQQGDSGVRSVESVTVTATTGTAGAFGVTLFKPLIPYSYLANTPYASQINPMIHLGGFMPEVLDNACLWLVFFSANATGVALGELRFAEDT